MLLLIAVLLLALGLLSGAVLVLSAFGALAASSALTLWILFPLLSIVGFSLAATQAQPAQVRGVTVAASGTLLLLAVASAGALVLGTGSLVPAPVHPASLWYVLAVGLVLGPVGLAAFSGQSSQDAPGR